MTPIGRPHPEILDGLLQRLTPEGRVGEIPVRGTSMHPTLHDGDRLWLVAATGKDVRVGDLVAQKGETGPIIHRLVGWWPTRQGWRLLTKGDGLPHFDPPLLPERLVGRVVARVRAGEIERLEGLRIRFRERGRAALSLLAGLRAEAWDRIRRAVTGWVGWPRG